MTLNIFLHLTQMAYRRLSVLYGKKNKGVFISRTFSTIVDTDSFKFLIKTEHILKMDSMWWVAGATICGVCTVVGTLGNGMTIAIFLKFPKFRNLIGTLILRFVKSLYT